MLHPKLKQTAKLIIAQCIFDHKALPASLISKLTRYSLDTVYQTLKAPEFESVKIPISHHKYNRSSVRLHTLSPIGEKYLGRFRNPEAVHAAVAMSYYRLPSTWYLLERYNKSSELLWSLTPWRPSEKSPWFDGLFCLRYSGNKAKLMGFVNLDTFTDPALYFDYIQAWIELLKSIVSMSHAPARLVIFAPEMNRTLYNYLSKSFENQPGEIMFWGLEGYNNYFQLHLPLYKGWKKHSFAQPVLRTFLDKDRFDHEIRFSPFPKSVTEKSTSSDPSFFAFKELPTLSRPAPRILRRVGEYPTLPLSEYAKYFSWSKKLKKELRSKFRYLEDEGYLRKITVKNEGYALTEKGVLLVAGVNGVGVDEARRFLGRPDEIKRFKRERRHLTSSKQAAMYLQSKLDVIHWEFLNTRIRFEKISFPFGNQTAKQVVVEPDSILYLKDKNSGNPEALWLELDRGTRQGEERVRRQLEKYFLIMMAKLQPKPIAPVLYIVDADENSETRLAYIARLLEHIGRRYQQYIPPQVFILTTMEELFSDTDTPFGERQFRTILAGEEIQWMAFDDCWEAWMKRAKNYRGRPGGCCDRKLIALISPDPENGGDSND